MRSKHTCSLQEYPPQTLHIHTETHWQTEYCSAQNYGGVLRYGAPFWCFCTVWWHSSPGISYVAQLKKTRMSQIKMFFRLFCGITNMENAKTLLVNAMLILAGCMSLIPCWLMWLSQALAMKQCRPNSPQCVICSWDCWAQWLYLSASVCTQRYLLTDIRCGILYWQIWTWPRPTGSCDHFLAHNLQHWLSGITNWGKGNSALSVGHYQVRTNQTQSCRVQRCFLDMGCAESRKCVGQHHKLGEKGAFEQPVVVFGIVVFVSVGWYRWVSCW